VFGVRSGLLGTELVLRFGFKVKSGIGSGDGDFSGAGGGKCPTFGHSRRCRPGCGHNRRRRGDVRQLTTPGRTDGRPDDGPGRRTSSPVTGGRQLNRGDVGSRIIHASTNERRFAV